MEIKYRSDPPWGNECDTKVFQEYAFNVIENPELDFEIRSAEPMEWKQSLEVLWSDVDPALRRNQILSALESARNDVKAMDGLFVCLMRGEVVGAILGTVQPGQYAVLSKPAYVAPGYSELYRQYCCQLIDICSNWAISKGSSLLQCLLEPSALDAKACFELCEYSGFTNIDYLAIEIRSFNKQHNGAIELEASNPKNQPERWKKILKSTYVDTLDCPFLSGRRNLQNVIDGYISTGDFDPNNWRIVKHQGKDIGCLILTEHRAAHQTELIYFGIRSEERGRGFGKDIVEEAIKITEAHRSDRLILAVDRNNQPAIDIYQQFGFRKWESRLAMLKFVAEGSSNDHES